MVLDGATVEFRLKYIIVNWSKALSLNLRQNLEF